MSFVCVCVRVCGLVSVVNDVIHRVEVTEPEKVDGDRGSKYFKAFPTHGENEQSELTRQKDLQRKKVGGVLNRGGIDLN